ncbi:unnamed protein product [Ixodes hexagonus]
MYSSFAPHVRNYLQALLEYAVQNLKTTHAIRVISAGEGGPRDGTRQYCDRFRLLLPYAGQSVTWEVIFQAHRPEFPPDFIFDDMSFLPKIEDIPGLWDWDADDEQALVKVVFELLDQYRKHQASLLDDFPRLQFEYSSLIHQSDISESNIQVHLNRKRWKLKTVARWHKLPPDSRGPAISIQPSLRCEEDLVNPMYRGGEKPRPLPLLLNYSGRIETGLGGTMSLKIPAFSKDGCLMDYVPLVKQLLENKVEQVSTSFAKRKEYISAFLSLFGRSLIEFDSEGFASISFLFEHDDFFFILNISIPRSFPHDKPSLTFQSVYHASGGWPYSITCTDYPYSPRWDPNEMADRAR